MHLEKRIESEKGEVAICIFRRDDGFYQYRMDSLRPEDAECLAFWVEGYPLSGLHQTAEEAEATARASPAWLDAQPYE
jgi:hypothetical protein